ncbi:ADAMTS-like protein 1, partial [Diaphorina citri]|uniref:ADAMTS-like protein 1 n=1 Tax=Diaphorina citri TaxID=121845 RepID=A0A3Q0IMU8_DIACI
MERDVRAPVWICVSMDCARWVAEPWGLCSVPCGKGIRSRKYYCAQDIDGVQTRVSHHHCTKQHKPKNEINSCLFPDWNGRTLELEYRFHNYSTAEKLVGKLSPSDPTWSPDEWSDCSAPCGPGVRRRKVKCKIFLEFSKTFATLPDGECRGARPMIEEKCMVEPCVAKNRWVTEPWSNCSVPCGEGFKTRSVLCKTYLENARVLATVPDSQCEEVKPVDRQRCVMPLCALEHKLEAAAFQDEEIKVVSGSKGAFTYSWRSDDYTQCSKSCLQGVQETIVMCIRDQDSRSVHPGLCDPKTKPEVLYRTCNDFSCPPRWQTGEFQPCSKKCGLGIQLREVQCIHEVVRNSTSVVPNIQCPQPPPPDRQYCAVVDCEIQWHTDKWSK